MVWLIALLMQLTAESPSASSASLCSVMALRENSRNNLGYQYTAAQIVDIVKRSDVIVRGVAVGRFAPGSDSTELQTITFRTLEVMRGVADKELHLPGTIVNRDDFNRGSVPYLTVRPAGQGGGCFAYDYRIGAEYLFLLKVDPKRFDMHWAPLAPMNEQVRGADDPWVVWVREQARNR